MNKVDLTPAKLADIKKKAEGCDPKYWVMDQHGDVMAVDFDSEGTQPKIARVEFLEDAEHIAAADPATVLALVEEIERHAEDMHLIKMTFLGFLRHQVDKSITTGDLLKIASNMLEKTGEIIKQESEAGQ